VWWVPLSLFSNYEIVDYAPQVEGAHTLNEWRVIHEAGVNRVIEKLWSNAPI
jgi:hypothetical protein